VSEIGKAIGGLILGLIVIAVIVLVGWRVGWWFKEQNVERQAHIFRKGYANQERLREDAAEKLSDIRAIEVQIGELGRGESDQAQRLQAQATAITTIACHDVSQIAEVEPELESFTATRCGLSSVAP